MLRRAEGTYTLHQQFEFFRVFLLLQVFQSEGEVTPGFINQCFQGNQIVTESQQARNMALHSKTYKGQGTVNLKEKRDTKLLTKAKWKLPV